VIVFFPNIGVKTIDLSECDEIGNGNFAMSISTPSLLEESIDSPDRINNDSSKKKQKVLDVPCTS